MTCPDITLLFPVFVTFLNQKIKLFIINKIDV